MSKVVLIKNQSTTRAQRGRGAAAVSPALPTCYFCPSLENAQFVWHVPTNEKDLDVLTIARPACRRCFNWFLSHPNCCTCRKFVGAKQAITADGQTYCLGCVSLCVWCKKTCALTPPTPGQDPQCEACEASCSVCMEQLTPNTVASVCHDHRKDFCHGCLGQYLQTMLRDAFSFLYLRCPAPKCQSRLSPEDIRRFSGSYFQKYERLMTKHHGNRLREVLQSDDEDSKALATWIRENTRYCPQCHVVIERNDGCNQLVCSCGFIFCYGCGGPYDKCNGYKCHSSTTPGQRSLQPLMAGKAIVFPAKTTNRRGGRVSGQQQPRRRPLAASGASGQSEAAARTAHAVVIREPLPCHLCETRCDGGCRLEARGGAASRHRRHR